MPFTPLHMGPGIWFKLLLRGSFSLMVFGWAQILMDIQPLLVIISGEGHLHGFSHTLIGATLIAGLAAASGKPLIETCLRARWLRLSPRERAWFELDRSLTWPVTVFSAFIGTLSHVYLDAIMHSDLQPFYPFSAHNPVLGQLGIDLLNRVCLYSGLAGVTIYAVLRFAQRRRISGSD